ncbi:MAG: ISKra4 family transposase [Acidobacteriaceae bacterium]|nr:ISKra4 family transposase [Acidobacteriaceae bacterium]MBV9227601.1 ISKra4 family transposase [Acidobacteriaceae bacterium]
MTFQIRVVAIADNGQGQVHEITSLQRTELKMETLGLTLVEGKAILSEIQRVVVEAQTAHGVAAHRHCPDCGQARHSKGHHDLSLRTVFGKVTVASPRLLHCDCHPHETKSYSPLAQVLPERTTPELLFLETKWASLMSYGLTAELLEEVLPMDAPLPASTIREHVCSVAQRLENELGEEQFSFIDGCQRDWNQLPPPNGPLTVGIDGGYIRGRNKSGHFEVIAGKSLLSFRREPEQTEELSGKCFAFVQTYDEKPKRRLFELLRSQGLQMNQQVDFLSDGGEDVRQVQLYLNPEAEHLLDWFHLTMRLTVLLQIAKGVPEKIGAGEEEYELRPQAMKQLESIKWYLWHGNTFQALHKLESLEMDLEAAAYESKDENTRKLWKGVEELHTYVERNQNFIPNYGERYRHGEKIASGFVESAVNQVVSKRMVKRQQMQWTQRGAHLLLQIRTRVLNEEWEDTFRRWYPGFRPQTEGQPIQKAA